MKEVKLTESNVIQNAITAFSGMGVDADADMVIAGFEGMMESTSDFLRMVKSKQKTALLFNDVKGNMIAAAVLEYNENEDEDGQPNYNYYWTFDKEDVEGEDVKKYEANQEQVVSLLTSRLYQSHNFRLSRAYAAVLAPTCLTMLSDALTENAKDGEEYSITHEGYFVASSSVGDGKIVKSLLPAGPMKVLIKDDATVQPSAA